MKFDKLIKEIVEFESKQEPDALKVIVGLSVASTENQSNFDIINKLDVYKTFGHCAFIISKWKTANKNSESCVWALLLNCSTLESKDFLNEIKARKLESKLIEWLYFKHGVVMVNRQNHNPCFFVFKKKNVTHVLITSDRSYTRILNNFDSKTKVAIVQHPSPKNWGLKNSFWFKHSDKTSKEAKTKKNAFKKALAKDFCLDI